MSESPYISAATASDFNDKVVARSHDAPVLVDFWAEWCGPCRSLAPVLHALVDELKGAVLLVTVDTDSETDLARGYQVRSLPTVKLFKNGEVVDEFMGALPASQVRSFLEPHVVRASDIQAREAERLAGQGDFTRAQELFQQAITDDPGNLNLRLSYARAAVDAGDLDLANDLIAGVPLESSQERGVQRLRALIAFHGLADPERGEDQLESDAAALTPEALRTLAARRVLRGDYASAMDLQLQLLKTNKRFGDNAAQKDMLAVFELADDPRLVSDYRRRMFNLLY